MGSKNQWYPFGVGAPPIFRLYLSGGDWEVHWGYVQAPDFRVLPTTQSPPQEQTPLQFHVLWVRAKAVSLPLEVSLREHQVAFLHSIGRQQHPAFARLLGVEACGAQEWPAERIN